MRAQQGRRYMSLEANVKKVSGYDVILARSTLWPVAYSPKVRENSARSQ